MRTCLCYIMCDYHPIRTTSGILPLPLHVLPHVAVSNCCAALFIVGALHLVRQQHVLINQLVFPTQPFVVRQVKGRNVATKCHENLVTTMPLDHGSPCFVTILQQPALLILIIMKSKDTRQESLWRPRISSTERKYLQLESYFLVHV